MHRIMFNMFYAEMFDGKKITGGLVKSWIITTFAGRLYPKTERIGACSMLLGRASLSVMM